MKQILLGVDTKMAFLNKLSVVAATSTAALLTLEMVVTAPAQAALFKFSFEGDGANGYFIFDDSVQSGQTVNPDLLGEYYGSVQEYAVTFGGNISAQGSKGSDGNIEDEARTIVALQRPELSQGSTNDDDFILFVPAAARQLPTGLSVRFRYPEGTFEGSIAQPTSVPNTALVTVYPYWDFPRTMGDVGFEGTVQTLIQEVPEPSSLPALFGVGAWFVFRRRQRRQVLRQR